MQPARSLLLLLTIVFLLASSCGSPPEDASSASGSSESSSASKGNDASAASTMNTETTVEKTTSAPETAAEKAAKKGVPEKKTKEGSKPKRKPAGKVVEVSIRALKYLPGPVTVSPGTTVRWTNEDQALHTVTSEASGRPLQSKELEQGESYEYKFRKPGQYNYYCMVHPFMKSGVTVE